MVSGPWCSQRPLATIAHGPVPLPETADPLPDAIGALPVRKRDIRRRLPAARAERYCSDPCCTPTTTVVRHAHKIGTANGDHPDGSGHDRTPRTASPHDTANIASSRETRTAELAGTLRPRLRSSRSGSDAQGFGGLRTPRIPHISAKNDTTRSFPTPRRRGRRTDRRRGP